jgi:RNA polymerase sigma factor (sigma-70 family)
MVSARVVSGVRQVAPEGGGVDASFEALYAGLRPRMVRLAYLSVGSTAVAEEIVQEAFVGLHRHFDRVDNPSAYLRKTVVNLCITARRRREMEAERLAVLGEPGRTGEVEVDEMWDVLARLRPERRLVLVLRYYEDLSHRDIARLIGCPVATVRTRVRRGLSDLRKELGQ